MADIPKIVLPHGGYKKLIVYRKSEVIYQGTVVFCRRFLPAHGDRTVDQMTQRRTFVPEPFGATMITSTSFDGFTPVILL